MPNTTIVLVAMTERKMAMPSGQPNSATMTEGSNGTASLSPRSSTALNATRPRNIEMQVDSV